MYKKFRLEGKNLNASDFSSGSSVGSSIYEQDKKNIENDLEEYKDLSGVLDAKQIMGNWFPNIKADVFLSHSHKDEKLALQLAGWLSVEFGLRSFIDSCVWGYADNLLKEIDDEFCKNSDGNTYSYQKRNFSTAHVHMMLASSLMSMIDRCECIIFIDTPQSFTPEVNMKNGHTISPWIFYELSLTNNLRIKQPERGALMDSALSPSMEARDLQVTYPADLSDFTDLTWENLADWKRRVGDQKGVETLDKLYGIFKGGSNG